MSQLVNPVTIDRHSGKRWLRFQNYAYAAQSNIAPLALTEIAHAARALPLGFVKNGDRYSLVAVLGYRPSHNLYVLPSGRWIGNYTPAILRGYPFLLRPNPENSSLTLYVNEANGFVLDAAGAPQGEKFFEADGSFSPATKKVLDFLVSLTRDTIAAAKATDTIVEHGLLEPWPMSFGSGAAEKRIDGLSRVSESALNRMDADSLLKLRNVGGLAMAYAQMFSMGHTAMFAQLEQMQEAEKKRAAQQDNSRFILRDEDAHIDWSHLLRD